MPTPSVEAQVRVWEVEEGRPQVWVAAMALLWAAAEGGRRVWVRGCNSWEKATVVSAAFGCGGATKLPLLSPASDKLGEGIFLRIAIVSISSPVEKTRSSSEPGSNLARSCCVTST